MTPIFTNLKGSNKYHRTKVVFDGIEFDSKLEGERYLFLKDMERQGFISNLQRQVRFEVVPRQCVKIPRIGKKGQPLMPKVVVVEKNVEYIADFTYFVRDKVCIVVEDTKGFKTKDYIIKRKLMRLQGHPITEVRKACQSIPI